MKWRVIFFLLAVYGRAGAQLAESLNFVEKTHDFGSIQETGGNAEFEFTFTNNSGRTIRILNVQASCGCTTPGWSRDPISPGNAGFVKASFNPIGRPGFFNKTLTVTTDLDGTPIVLQIKGNVLTEAMDGDLSRLSDASGNLMLRSASINLGKVYINKASAPLDVKVYNRGKSPIRFTSVEAPSYLKVKTPDVLAPGATGTLQVWLDARQKSQYGFLTESIAINTDDEALPLKHFSVYATVEEYFEPLSDAEKKKAPVLILNAPQLDLKQVKMGSTVSGSVILRNDGKQDLLIRALQPNCSCITTDLKNKIIRPGAEETLAITLEGSGRTGTQHKGVTVYSNDPARPVQRITVQVVVN